MLRIKSDFRRWLRNDTGAFAIYFGLTFPILLATAGFGVDYWTNVAMKARLDAAADTAALAGVKAATAYMQLNPRNQKGDDLIASAKSTGNDAAAKAFKANAGANYDDNIQLTPPSLNYANWAFSLTVSYNGSRNTNFAGVLGLKSLPLNGSASATQQQATYINVTIVVDISQSMGIAANQTEMTKLYDATTKKSYSGIGCVFACHEPQGAAVSYLSVARASNVTLRIDVARTAIANMAKAAKTAQETQLARGLPVSDNIGFSVYSMQRNLYNGTYLTKVYPEDASYTSKYSDLVTAMTPPSYKLDLGPNANWGEGDSAQTNSLAVLADKLTTSGDGSSANSPINYVFVVTDGTEDVNFSGLFPCVSANPTGHCTRAVPSSACDPIKKKGATVGVIYTTYVPIYNQNDPKLGLNDAYTWLVAPAVGSIPGNLKGCATAPSWYYEASDDVTLLDAMKKLFDSTLSKTRLTN